MPQEKFKNQYRVKSNRHPTYDYSLEGGYFITICAHNRQHLFGEIADEKMILNELGEMAENEWKRTEKIRKNITIDEFVIMPNHIHGIVFIDYKIDGTVETNCNLSLQKNNIRQHGTSQTIGSIIRGFKIGVTKYARKNSDINTVWQSNYHDRIIRNETELEKIREYIYHNPAQWEYDKENPENIFM